MTLNYDNGDGLDLPPHHCDRRPLSVHHQGRGGNNVGNAPVTLYPYALISRHGTPKTLGYYILHEGLIGYLGDQGLQEYTYKKIDDAKKRVDFNVTDGWLGITDKYWAAALLPDTAAQLQARFSTSKLGNVDTYQTDYLDDAQTIAIGGTGSANARLFAGAKEAASSASISRSAASAATTSNSHSTISIC